MIGLSKADQSGAKPAAFKVAALLCGTALAGLPLPLLAQDAAPQQAEPQVEEPAAAVEEAPVSNTIRSITVVGAERLEPSTILSYIRLRVGQEYTSAAAEDRKSTRLNS